MLLSLWILLSFTAVAGDQTVNRMRLVERSFAAAELIGTDELKVKLGKSERIKDRLAAHVRSDLFAGTSGLVRVRAMSVDPLRFYLKTADGYARLQNQSGHGLVTVHYDLQLDGALYVTSEYAYPSTKKIKLQVAVRKGALLQAPAPVVKRPTPPAKLEWMNLESMVLVGELTGLDRTRSGGNADRLTWRVKRGDELTIAVSSHDFDPRLTVVAPGQQGTPSVVDGTAAFGVPVPLHFDSVQPGFLNAHVSHGVRESVGSYKLIVATPMEGDLCASIEALDILSDPDPWKVAGLDYRVGKGTMQGIFHQRYPRPFDSCKTSSLGRVSVDCTRSRDDDEAGMREQYEATAQAFRACHPGWDVKELGAEGRRMMGIEASKGTLHRQVLLRRGSVRSVGGKAVSSHHLSLSLEYKP